MPACSTLIEFWLQSSSLLPVNREDKVLDKKCLAQAEIEHAPLPIRDVHWPTLNKSENSKY